MNNETMRKMTGDQIAAAIEEAQKKQQRADAAAKKQREADAKADALAAAEAARIAAEAHAEERRRAAVGQAAADAAAEVERLQQDAEQLRRYELLRSIEQSDAAVTLLERAYVEAEEFGDLNNAIRGGVAWADSNKNGALEGRRAMRVYLGVDIPTDLWTADSGGLTAKVHFMGCNWSGGFNLGEGSFLMVEVPGHGGWRQVYSPGGLAELCHAFPSLKAALAPFAAPQPDTEATS